MNSKVGEALDTAGIVLCAAGGELCGLGHAPWYAFLFPATGLALFALRLLTRSL